MTASVASNCEFILGKCVWFVFGRSSQRNMKPDILSFTVSFLDYPGNTEMPSQNKSSLPSSLWS